MELFYILLIISLLYLILILLYRYSNPLKGISRIPILVRSDVKFGVIRVLLCFAQIK